MTRRKEEFAPIDARNVRMYVCGPTVYDHAHIGNARPLIVFDVLFRLLREIYGAEHVTYVRNITDVDDKINARAAERGISIRELTEETNAIFQADAKALGCLEPTAQPRATEHIAAMIAIVERLLAAGRAYPADGHVLFDVPSMPDYGRLSRRSLDEMIAGARVEVAPYKKGPMDFVLWKPSSPDEPGWESPWGRGRPGWHLECSAMSWEYLGEVFDIHGGGIDLVFPHHENEIAQTCSAFGHEVMANYWLHNGFLQVEGEKMAKSLGNFVTIRELLTTDNFGDCFWPGDVVRLAMLKTHYREPINWRVDGLEEARKELLNWSDLIATTFDGCAGEIPPDFDDEEIESALSDDLNTPLAIARIHRLAQRAESNRESAISFVKVLKALGFRNVDKPGYFHPGFVANLFDSGPSMDVTTQREILKMRTLEANGQIDAANSIHAIIQLKGFSLKTNTSGVLIVGNETGAEFESRVDELLRARNEARADKDWAKADQIRNQLDAMGIALTDNKDGTTSWEVKR
ncbi:MAG: cysteine--tRNA ligase [Methylovirgula sp.]